MTSTVESLSSVKKKISFEIPADRVTSEIDKVFEKIRKRAALKGFRKGKAPQSLIEKHYVDVMEGDVLKNLFEETYFKALAEHKIFPVSHPVIDSDEIKRGTPFTYSATVEVLPEIDVKDYNGLEVAKETFTPDESVVEKRLQEMRENMSHLKPLDVGSVAETGHFAVIDFTGYVDDVPFEGGSAESYQLELGSGRFIPGFEEQIVGMKSGESKSVTLSFPEDYWNKDLAGKEARFDVTLSEIKVKELPELNDEFAAQMGEFDSIAQLRDKVAELYEKQESDRIKADLQDGVVQALIGKNEIEVPSTLVDRQLQTMLANARNRLAQQRLTFEMMGMNEESFKAQYRTVAENQVKGSLLLEAVAKKEGISVEEADIEKKLLEIAGGSEEELGRVKSFYEQNRSARENLVAHLAEEKVMSFLLESAVISEKTKE
ncbi:MULTISPECIES: trigger factor [Geobacter]|uniref:Trigger factor n=2 Tax=Geobacter TaxID=28231 RepID=A0A0C1QNF4_9BACT|nr:MULTISPECIES: trigger factor [Geobacter]ANA40250.1 trigger factor [Geobacter anodireducens]KIE42152.1 trigger factor [Geobacter soli]MBE2888656.1 trigger factor [Geobacter anodireducens]HMN01541.1 trigger factor [Geobacter anodireducens]